MQPSSATFKCQYCTNIFNTKYTLKGTKEVTNPRVFPSLKVNRRKCKLCGSTQQSLSGYQSISTHANSSNNRTWTEGTITIRHRTTFYHQPQLSYIALTTCRIFQSFQNHFIPCSRAMQHFINMMTKNTSI